MDLLLQVPASAGPVGLSLDGMLDETDEFCREGKLLTLEPPDDVIAFHRWYLAELSAQLEGAEPRPWSGEVR